MRPASRASSVAAASSLSNDGTRGRASRLLKEPQPASLHCSRIASAPVPPWAACALLKASTEGAAPPWVSASTAASREHADPALGVLALTGDQQQVAGALALLLAHELRDARATSARRRPCRSSWASGAKPVPRRRPSSCSDEPSRRPATKSSSRVTLKRTPPPTSAASRARAARSSGCVHALRGAAARIALDAAALGPLDRRDAGVRLLEQGHFARGERLARARPALRRGRLRRAGRRRLASARAAPRASRRRARSPTGLGSGSLRRPARSSSGPNAVPIGAGFFGCASRLGLAPACASCAPCLRA